MSKRKSDKTRRQTHPGQDASNPDNQAMQNDDFAKIGPLSIHGVEAGDPDLADVRKHGGRKRN